MGAGESKPGICLLLFTLTTCIFIMLSQMPNLVKVTVNEIWSNFFKHFCFSLFGQRKQLSLICSPPLPKKKKSLKDRQIRRRAIGVLEGPLAQAKSARLIVILIKFIIIYYNFSPQRLNPGHRTYMRPTESKVSKRYFYGSEATN